MAGIGFALRRLARDESLLGPIGACLHSAVIATGPWVLTVLSVSGLVWMAGDGGDFSDFEVLRLVMSYNFCLSLTIVSPLAMVVARVLGDAVFHRDLRPVTGLLVGSTALAQLLLFAAGLILYGGMLRLGRGDTLAAILHLMLIGQVWLVSVFLSTLRSYLRITGAFVIGLAVTLGAVSFLARPLGTFGMVLSCNIGLALTVALLIAATIREYPVALEHPFRIILHLRKHSLLAAGALVFNVGLWVDKVVMWGAPEARTLANGFVTFNAYESAMFLANLSVIPAMAAFLFNVETEFHERYLRFYDNIARHAPLRLIRGNHRELLFCMARSWRNFFVVQGSISLLVILCAPQIFSAFGLEFLELGVFRFGVFGSMFFVLVIFLTVFLSYFEATKKLFVVQLVFFLANLFWTLWSRELGFAFYGYGFFLGSLTAFGIGALLTVRHVFELPFHTFISNNSALTKRTALRA